MFGNMKLTLGFGTQVLMIAIIAVITSIVSDTVEKNARLAHDESAVFAGIARQMKLDVVQIQQWLSDISATRAQDGLDDGFDLAGKHKESFLAGLSKFREMYIDENDQESLNKLKDMEQSLESYYEEGVIMARAYIDGGPAEGNKLMAGFDKEAESLTGKLDPFVSQQVSELDTSMLSIVSSVRGLKLFILIASVIAVVLGIISAWLSIRSIIKPVKSVVESLNETAGQLASASEEISESSQSLSQGTSEQASSIEEASASMEEMASVAKQNAENIKEALQLASLCNITAESGNKSVNDMNNAMQAINESSRKIGDIIKEIDGIAFQTNLLALNAAVEAARAGEHGKGFAVVAEEVRNLAQRSASAAKDTTALIADCLNKADVGTKLSGKCKDVLSGIVANAKKVSVLINENSTSLQEQAEGADQVNIAIQQIDTVTQQNAANAEETAASSEEMSAQAQSLMDQIRILAAQVGGKVDGTLTTCEKPAKENSLDSPIHTFIKERQMGIDKTTTNVDNNGLGTTVPEALIPMGKNRIDEHGEHTKDF